MIWTRPLAFVLAPAVLVPLVIHLLTRLRAPRAIFPTVRFLPGSSSAATRRRQINDALLAAIRTAIVALAVVACAGPFFLTASRQRAWDATMSRAEIVDDRAGARLGERFPRAVAWLSSQPPGRREIVVRSSFPLGSISSSDLRAVPPHIGLRFERQGHVPSSRVNAAPAVIVSDASGTPVRIERESRLTDKWTLVRNGERRDVSPIPVEVVTKPDERAAGDEMMRELLADGVPAARTGQTARVLFDGTVPRLQLADAWMSDAAAGIARSVAEWIQRGRIALAVRFGSDGGRLVVATDASPSSAFGRMLVAAVFSALAPRVGSVAAETMELTDSQLAAWGRNPGPARVPSPRTIPRDDRRWVWALVLALIGVEAVVRRRAKSDPVAVRPVRNAGDESRVA